MVILNDVDLSLLNARLVWLVDYVKSLRVEVDVVKCENRELKDLVQRLASCLQLYIAEKDGVLAAEKLRVDVEKKELM